MIALEERGPPVHAQSSFLDFGTGASGNLTFGTYAPSALPTINNFASGNTLVFGSDLRSTISNSSFFTFTNGGIGCSSWVEGTNTFTITAIPEPSTCLAAIGLLALMLWPLRRMRVFAEGTRRRQASGISS